MVTVQVTAAEVSEAKRVMEGFDSNKVYDKMVYSTNYIGYLAESAFDKFLTEKGVPHSWIEFNKRVVDQPDFVIGNTSFDVKATSTDYLWFQKPQHDIYVYSQVSPTQVEFKKFITRDGMFKAIDDGRAKVVCHRGRQDFVIASTDLLDIKYLDFDGWNEVEK